MAAVLTVLLIVACLIWALTYALQGGVGLLRLGADLLIVLARIVVVLLGSLCWMIWFVFNRRAAMESLNKAREEHR